MWKIFEFIEFINWRIFRFEFIVREYLILFSVFKIRLYNIELYWVSFLWLYVNKNMFCKLGFIYFYYNICILGKIFFFYLVLIILNNDG